MRGEEVRDIDGGRMEEGGRQVRRREGEGEGGRERREREREGGRERGGGGKLYERAFFSQLDNINTFIYKRHQDNDIHMRWFSDSQ